MTGHRPTDSFPNQLSDAQIRTRLRLLGWGLAGGLVLVGIAAASSQGDAVREQVPKKVFEVETDDGPVDCFGEKPFSVREGETVSDIVLQNTVRVSDVRSWETPDLRPIVDAVLARNGITNPLQVPVDSAVAVPQYCTFAPRF